MLLMGSSTISTGPFSIAMLVYWPFSIANVVKRHVSSRQAISSPHPDTPNAKDGVAEVPPLASAAGHPCWGAKESLRFR